MGFAELLDLVHIISREGRYNFLAHEFDIIDQKRCPAEIKLNTKIDWLHQKDNTSNVSTAPDHPSVEPYTLTIYHTAPTLALAGLNAL